MSTYDGSTEGLDLTTDSGTTPPDAVTVSSNVSGQITAAWHVDGSVPAAGNTNRAAYDLPDGNFVGGNYFAKFQNKTIQTNVAYVACQQKPPRPTPILQRFDSWKDGHHFFVAFSVGWDGQKWIHSAQLGQYFPDGGYSFFELGTDDGLLDDDNDGSTWDPANVYHPYSPTNVAAADNWHVSVTAGTGTTISVTAPGVYKSPNPTNCDVSDPFFKYKFASPGDTIANVKALTTANQVVTLPATVPLSAICVPSGGLVCETDLTTLGGFVFFVDTTAGNSTAGLANSNITGIAYSGGAVGVSDTLGPGPNCPTPTVGGAVPQNPNFTPDTACHIDDDSVSRGSFLSEWWDTVNTFTF